MPSIEEPSSVGAERGRAIHDYMASVPSLGRDRALAMVPEDYREFARAIPIDRLPVVKEAWLPEAAYAWDPIEDRGYYLGSMINRAYPATLPGNTVVGTADAIGLADDQAVIIEWKTGKHWSEWQLKFLALAACRAHKCDRAMCVIVFLREDGTCKELVFRYDIFDLGLFAEQLLGLSKRVLAAKSSGESSLVMGAHCEYCPAKLNCPAHTALIRSACAMPANFAAEFEVLTPEAIGKAWPKLVAALQILHRAKAQIETWVTDNGPVPLENGKELRTVVTGRESVAYPRAVADILHGMFPDYDIMGAFKLETSKAAITKVVQSIAVHKGISGRDLKESVFAAVRAAGAIARTTWTRVEEVRIDGKGRDTNPSGVDPKEYGEKFAEAILKRFSSTGPT